MVHPKADFPGATGLAAQAGRRIRSHSDCLNCFQDTHRVTGVLILTPRPRKVPKIIGADSVAICDYPREYSRELVDRFLNGLPFVIRHEGYGHAAIAAKYPRIVAEAARRQSER